MFRNLSRNGFNNIIQIVVGNEVIHGSLSCLITKSYHDWPLINSLSQRSAAYSYHASLIYSAPDITGNWEGLSLANNITDITRCVLNHCWSSKAHASNSLNLLTTPFFLTLWFPIIVNKSMYCNNASFTRELNYLYWPKSTEYSCYQYEAVRTTIIILILLLLLLGT